MLSDDTKGIHLRPISRTDLENLCKWRNQSRAFIFDHKILSLDAQELWYAGYLQNNKDTRFIITVIKPEPKDCGVIGLTNIDHLHQTAELTIILSPETRGTGTASRALKLLLDYSFSELNLNRIEAQVLSDNKRAIDFYLKNKFTNEGVRRQAIFKHGGFKDVFIMSILKKEWH